jgi:YebC/PmpR family DNA-binding regulatory protein
MGRHGTIAGRKEKQDSKRSAMFTKVARAITVAAKNGGDPEYNAELKQAIDKGKAINMPNDNITRAIKKGTGEIEGVTYEEMSFEGYGASGVAVIVDVLTDNKNRTTSAVKSTFDKFGGNLGTPGCVSYMFSKKGVIYIEKTDNVVEDDLMEVALEAGMEDMIVYEDSFEILTAPEDFAQVSEQLRKAGYEFVEADIEYLPSMEVTPNPQDMTKLTKMIDILEDNDDVQKVYHNCAVPLEG